MEQAFQIKLLFMFSLPGSFQMFHFELYNWSKMDAVHFNPLKNSQNTSSCSTQDQEYQIRLFLCQNHKI